ncbi:MAG: hypothetical protein ACW99A_11180 [Candidatus Kariarchaeaceae archaeon]|jgi:hypothetical protein
MSLTTCPHCGKEVGDRRRVTHTFRKWATPSLIILISLMLLALDVTLDGDVESWSLEWAHWATIGIWLIYIPTQLLRSAPVYGWLIIPFGGILASIFFFLIDRAEGENNGFLGLDWAWGVIIPVMTFIVIFPIISHYARDEITHLDQLEYLVDSLSSGANNDE